MRLFDNFISRFVPYQYRHAVQPALVASLALIVGVSVATLLFDHWPLWVIVVVVAAYTWLLIFYWLYQVSGFFRLAMQPFLHRLFWFDPRWVWGRAFGREAGSRWDLRPLHVFLVVFWLGLAFVAATGRYDLVGSSVRVLAQIIEAITRQHPVIGFVAMLIAVGAVWLLKWRFALPIVALDLTWGYNLWFLWKPAWEGSLAVVSFAARGTQTQLEKWLLGVPFVGLFLGRQIAAVLTYLVGLTVVGLGIYVFDRIWSSRHPFNNLEARIGRPFEAPICYAAALLNRKYFHKYFILWFRDTGIRVDLGNNELGVDLEGPAGFGVGAETWAINATKSVEVSEPVGWGGMVQFVELRLKSAADRTFTIPFSTKGLRVQGRDPHGRAVIFRGEEAGRMAWNQVRQLATLALEEQQALRQQERAAAQRLAIQQQGGR